MKKIIIFLIVVFSLVLFVNKVNASENTDYVNLFDAGAINYDNTNQKFYSDQMINLKKNLPYTMVVSKKFFGTNTNLAGKFFENICVDSNGDTISIGFSFTKSSSIEVYHASYTPTVNCRFKVTDLLIKGVSLESLNRDGIILYQGELNDFKGFYKYADLTGYEKTGVQYDIYTEVDNLISLDTITNNLKAYDSNDGELNNVTLISSEYKEERKLGVYKVIYSVTDTANNKTNLTVNVNVEDNEKPVFTGPDELQWHCYDEWPSDEEIIKHYTAYDNLDGDVTEGIFVSSSEKIGYKIGANRKYIVNLGVYDSAGNEARKVLFLVCSDLKGPKLVCEDVECGLSTLYSDGIDNVLERVLVGCTDESGVDSITFSSKEFVDNNGFSGRYLITVTATDAVGNVSTAEAYINIVDDIAPEFYIKTNLITTTDAASYTLSDIKEIIEDKLVSDGILYEDINMISCDYFGNENTPGEYEVKFMYRYKDTINYMVGTITVTEEASPVNTTHYWLIGIGAAVLLSVVVIIYKKRRSII